MFITQPMHLELDLPSMLYGFLGPWRSKHRKPPLLPPSAGKSVRGKWEDQSPPVVRRVER